MTQAAPFAEIWRGPFLESVHSGHAVICDETGQIVQSWGDPGLIVLPRSSAKMIQALPLVQSGAADKAGLGTEQLALACASHQGAAIHTERVGVWLDGLGLQDDDYRCGPQDPDDRDAHERLIRAHQSPCQVHNNCSGKHAGFLTLSRHMGAGPEYVDPAHPVQRACLEAFEAVTRETSPGFGIDGCSAPNFAVPIRNAATAYARLMDPGQFSTEKGDSCRTIVRAMTAYPEMVSGEGRFDTLLMQVTATQLLSKGGAEG